MLSRPGSPLSTTTRSLLLRVSFLCMRKRKKESEQSKRGRRAIEAKSISKLAARAATPASSLSTPSPDLEPWFSPARPPPPRISTLLKNSTGEAAVECTGDPKEGKVEKTADEAPTTAVAAAAAADDDDREPPHPAPPPPPKPKPCSSCGADSRYQCPRCGERSCSAPCVGKHKEATGELENEASFLSFFRRFRSLVLSSLSL